MRKKYYLSTLCILIVTYTFCQNNVELVAKAYNDSVLLGSSVNISLAIEGIDLNFELENTPLNNKVLVDKNNRFNMTIEVIPKDLGINKYGPYSVDLMGKKIISNEIEIFTLKREPEEITILIPSVCRLNQEVEIKILNYSESKYNLNLKESEYFKVKSTSSSTSIINGKYTKILRLKVVLIKKGNLQLDKKSFKSLPRYVDVKSVLMSINN